MDREGSMPGARRRRGSVPAGARCARQARAPSGARTRHRPVETYTPTWLAQMPSLVEARDSLQHETFGATPERMLREIAEALEALTADTPLVLFLDDLHWSDDATVDFVGLMARRAGPSRLLLVLAYRPVDVALARPGLKTMKRELAAKGSSGPAARLSHARGRGRAVGRAVPRAPVSGRTRDAPSSSNQRQSVVHDQPAGVSRGAGDDRAGRRLLGADGNAGSGLDGIAGNAAAGD